MKREDINKIITHEILPHAENNKNNLCVYLTEMLTQSEELYAEDVTGYCGEILEDIPLCETLRKSIQKMYDMAAAELDGRKQIKKDIKGER